MNELNQNNNQVERHADVSDDSSERDGNLEGDLSNQPQLVEWTDGDKAIKG